MTAQFDSSSSSESKTNLYGLVLRSHAGGYHVHVPGYSQNVLCQARGRLKKEQISILTGDKVGLDEFDPVAGTAIISNLLERRNCLGRPPVTNIDQAIIVLSARQPDFSPSLLDRYLVHFQLELPNINCIICLNKADLCDENELRELQNIYQNLGYRFLIVSAFNGLGLKDLAELFAGKVSVLCGRSGVGKSSILNKLDPNLRLDVDQREKAIKVGRHTTTASQLFSLNLTNWLNSHTESWIADTPGFSPSELNHPESRNLHLQFPELAILAEKCQFDDCLHQAESGCNILSNKEEISPSRLESYYLLLEEAKQSERMLKSVSRKVESKVKNVAGSKGRNISIPKLSKKYRQESKRQSRQSLQKLEELETEDNNSKQHFFEE